MTCFIHTHGVVGAAPGNVNCQPWSSQSSEKSLHIKTEAQITNMKKKNVEKTETREMKILKLILLVFSKRKRRYFISETRTGYNKNAYSEKKSALGNKN